MPVIGPQADDLPSPSPSGSGHVGSYAILCAAAKQLRREQLRSSKGSDTVAAAGLPGIMSPTLTPRQALGLGLPLARGLIRNHGRLDDSVLGRTRNFAMARFLRLPMMPSSWSW